jgi:hypothetical protein
MPNDNVLRKIPPDLLGAAGYALPEAPMSDDATQRVVLKLPDGSRAEVVFVKLRSKKGRSTRWFWTPDSAVIIEDK